MTPEPSTPFPNPFFTIVIPTLNEEKYLPLLLKDLTQQTYKNFQVIVVDSQSEDQTIKMVSKYINKLPLTIKQTPIRNVSHQRNLGAKSSQSPYLVFFDADTKIPPEYLKSIAQYLTFNPVDVLTTWIDDSQAQLKSKITAVAINSLLELLKYIYPSAWGSHLIIKSSAFKNSGGFEPQITLTQKTINKVNQYLQYPN